MIEHRLFKPISSSTTRRRRRQGGCLTWHEFSTATTPLSTFFSSFFRSLCLRRLFQLSSTTASHSSHLLFYSNLFLSLLFGARNLCKTQNNSNNINNSNNNNNSEAANKPIRTTCRKSCVSVQANLKAEQQQNQESILPYLVFTCSPILIVKLELPYNNLTTKFIMKYPRLRAGSGSIIQ